MFKETKVGERVWEYIPTVEDRQNPDCRLCVHELPVNESRLFCPTALSEGRYCQMKKNFGSVQITKQWVEQYNPAAGKVIRSKKHLEETFKQQSDEMSERLNQHVDLQIADLSDTKTLKVTEAGLDSTHDEAVRTGRKESRGKFIF